MKRLENELRIVVSANDVLMKVKANKDRFVKSMKALLKAYEKKTEEYKIKYTKYTQKVIEKTLKEDEAEPQAPPKPIDRTKDYDFYIEMQEKHIPVFIKLSESDFKKLYKDDWVWMRSFLNVMSMYAEDSVEVSGAMALYE